MAVPAVPIASPVRGVPSLDVQSLIQRLPAEIRAGVAWAQRPIERALERLGTEPLTDELVAGVTRQALKPLLSVSLAVWQAMAPNPEKWRTLLLDDFRREEEQLRLFLADEEAADTLRCVSGELRSLYELAFMLGHADDPSALDHAALDELETDTELESLMRSSIAMTAATQLSKQNGDRGRAHDLLDVAFLELRRFGSVLAKRGMLLVAYPDESVPEREQRRLRAIRSLRGSLTDADWVIVEQARMRDLR